MGWRHGFLHLGGSLIAAAMIAIAISHLGRYMIWDFCVFEGSSALFTANHDS
jgi:hypothetical protein